MLKPLSYDMSNLLFKYVQIASGPVNNNIQSED